MNSKDPSSKKAQLMDDLKSLKNVLDEDDDNVPLLLGDEEDGDIPILEDDDGDIPILEDDDDDIPVLGADTQASKSADQASLEAALKQLESMELAPSSRKKPAAPGGSAPVAPKSSIEDQIRSNAGTPRIKPEELTKVRENPFLNTKQKEQLEQSRRLQAEAQKLAAITALNKKAATKPLSATDASAAEPIEFTDNPFLKASSSAAKTNVSSSPNTLKPEATPEPQTEHKPAPEMNLDVEMADIDNELCDLGDIIIPEDDENEIAPTPKQQAPASKNLRAKKLDDNEINLLLDEVVDEYLVVLEAALRKKLKEKLPHLLK